MRLAMCIHCALRIGQPARSCDFWSLLSHAIFNSFAETVHWNASGWLSILTNTHTFWLPKHNVIQHVDANCFSNFSKAIGYGNIFSTWRCVS